MDDQTQTTPTADTYAGKTREEVRALRQQHGEERVKTMSVPTRPGQRLQVIVRAPSRDEYEMYMDALLKADKRPEKALAANRNLLIRCLLAPEAAAVAAELDARPFLTDKLVEPILNMAGADAEVREDAF